MKRVRLLAAALAFATPIAVIAAGPVVMHRAPGCPCCGKWAVQVKVQFGRAVRVVNDADRPSLMKSRGMPQDLAACHTAIIDGMTLEGHVPIADMKRALATRSKGVSGLAVTGMPMGSLGMEMPGMKAQPYDVVAFGSGGRLVFAHH